MVRETHAEKAARLQRKSLELQYKDTRLKVEKILRERPDSLPKVRDYLVSLGLWGEAAGSESGATATAPSPASKGQEKEEAGENDQGDSSEMTPKGKAPHKTYTRMENIPVTHLRRWLGQIEKCPFNEGQLNMLVK